MGDNVDDIKSIFLFGLVGLVLLWIAKSRGFFHFPKEKEPIPVKLQSVIIVFAIYIVMTVIVAPLFVHALRSAYARFADNYSPLAASSCVQFIAMAIILLLFYLYSKTATPLLFRRILKDRSIHSPKPIYVDFFMGVITWCVTVPLMIALGSFVDVIINSSIQYQPQEQVAVRFLLESMKSPTSLVFTLPTILILAPIIEEFLFRGNLQTFFKRYMMPKKAIFLTALCFAFFHYSSSQGWSNVSLIATLFIFGLFLGFIYERQASLYASIGLHMTFNLISTIRIMFFS